MAETFSVWEYIAAMFIGWGVFSVGVIIVAFVSNLFKSKPKS
jgi:hypothetical protein